MTIESRMPRAEYDAIEALSITQLKGLRRSPQHFLHYLQHPKSSEALTLGIAGHTATLEPERFASDFAVWDRRTESGRLGPRNGKWWDAFRMENKGKTVLNPDQAAVCKALSKAVRHDATAGKYLESGDPEVTLEWSIDGRMRKGRVDWLMSYEGEPYIVGLKTARDCSHFAFGNQAARLGYHLQWAWYHDGFQVSTGRQPQLIEIVVESEAPHAVATYRIPQDIILQGRDEYNTLLRLLLQCEASGEWPGPVPKEEYLTLPSWAYPDLDDDISSMGLEAA
jgi:exodeoxyribonuclease VIII